MGCGDEMSALDRSLVNIALAGGGTRIDPQTMFKAMQSVAIESEKSSIHLLTRRQIEDAKDLAKLENYHLNIDASDRLMKNVWDIAKHDLKLKDYQIVNNPLICASKDALISKETIKAALIAMNKTHVNPRIYDVTRIPKIVFMDQRTARELGMSGKRGAAFKESAIRTNVELGRHITVIMNDKGELVYKHDPLQKIGHERTLEHILAHEAFHVHQYTGWGQSKFATLSGANAKAEWLEAAAEQNALPWGVRGRDGHDREFACECFATWATGESGLCPEMKQFFDRHFSKDGT